MPAGIEPVAVEIRVDTSGGITPLKIEVDGALLAIAQVGRSWSDDMGDHWHVMTVMPQRTFELIRAPGDRWHIRRAARPSLA